MSVAEPTPPPAPNRFERRRQQSRAALLEAAIGLFQEKGTRATKIEEICERADVATRTFFNHFETREHLYEAIARHRAEQLAAFLDASHDDPRPLSERLRGLFSATGRALAARPLYRELVAVMLRLGVEGGSEAARSRTLGAAVLRFVADGVERGEVTRRHAPEILADIVIGTLDTALTNWSASEDFDLETNLEQAASALVDLLEPSDDEKAANPNP